MSSQPKTRGALLTEEMMDIGVASFDARNPAAAEQARQLRTHLLADPRFVQYSLEYVQSAPIPDSKKTQMGNQTSMAHQEARDQILTAGEDPSLQAQVNELYERFNRDGNPNAGYTALKEMTEEQKSIARGITEQPQTTVADAPARSAPVITPAAQTTPAAVTEENGTRVHIVQKGENLSRIAHEQYGLHRQSEVHQKALEIARHNGINPNRLSIGQTLNLPGLAPSLASKNIAFEGATTEAGKPLATALGNDWSQATAPQTAPEAPATTISVGYDQNFKNIWNDMIAHEKSSDSVLGKAWQSGGQHPPAYLQTPEIAPAIAPAIDNARTIGMAPATP